MLFQFFSLIIGNQGIDHFIDIAIQKGVQLVDGHIDAVIGDPSLGEIVGADPLAAVAGTNLTFTVFGYFTLLFLLFNFIKSGLKNFEGLILIFELRLFILTGYHHPGRDMGNPHC